MIVLGFLNCSFNYFSKLYVCLLFSPVPIICLYIMLPFLLSDTVC